MSSNASSGAGRPESTGRSRWAQLARRGDQPAEGVAELRAVPLAPVEPAAEEHHLGDRLSSYLDGELGHDSRERVQAHLATCPDCLFEADAGRAVKHLLTHTGTPAPSTNLMARLMAVAALPDDDDRPGTGSSGDAPVRGTFGGSRLTGGSFGRGAGASFGGGALGAEAPISGFDPRAERPRPFGAGRPFGSRRDLVPVAPPLAAAAESAGLGRPAPQRGRRLVFAAAGAFSVAAVTLGGVGGIGALTAEEQPSTTVTPVGGPGAPAIVPMSAPLTADYPERRHVPVLPDSSQAQAQPLVAPAATPVVYPYRMMMR